MYTTATVNDSASLLTAISAFVVSNGWTIVTDTAEGTGRRLTINKTPGMYVHFRSVVNETPITNVSYNYGVCMLVSKTNNTTSTNSNQDWTNLNGILPINPTLSFTYHLFSQDSGNSISIAVVGKFIDTLSNEYVAFGHFGTSITKTTALNQGWYFCAQAAVYNGLLTYSASYPIKGEMNSFMLNVSEYSCNSSILGVYTTDTYYGSGPMYNSNSSDGSNGILPLRYSQQQGVGSYYTMYRNSASTAFANTTLIPSFIFFRHPTSGFNLMGTVPGVWLANSVPTLYKNGQIISIGSQDYAVFQNHVYEVHH
jgi:hypothetical protein